MIFPELSIQSVVLSIIFLLTAGGTALTSMVLLNIFVSSAASSNLTDFIAIFVVESIGALGMIICYVRLSCWIRMSLMLISSLFFS